MAFVSTELSLYIRVDFSIFIYFAYSFVGYLSRGSFSRFFPLGGFGGPEKDRDFVLFLRQFSRSFTTDPPGQLDIFGHDGYPLGVYGTQVGILKQSNQVSFSCFLKCHYRLTLEPDIAVFPSWRQIIQNNFSDQSLEW